MNLVKHTKDFQIDQPVENLFLLFSAEGEKYWVPGWDYKNIMDSTELHEDYIFVAENHDHAASDGYEQYISLGGRGVPVLLIDGKIVKAYNPIKNA
jgi:hypothetical protein